MPQPIRTLVFAAVALASLGLAWGMHVRNRPQPLSEFSDVGTAFYPDFEDPNAATGLQVAAYDAEAGKTNVFRVEYRDGMWKIPSHLDYPADGKDRLAKTAASMLNVERLALVERSKSAHKRYRVLDPLDEAVDGNDGRGDRITLYQGDQTVVDLIVGEKLDGSNEIYYVRQPGKDAVYTADLGNLEISTNFADWIQADLLELDRNELAKIIIDTYHIDEEQGTLIPEEQFELKKGEGTAWELEGLDPATEKLKTAEVTSTVAALDDLKIIGIRRKPTALSAALKGEGGGLDLQVQMDMQEKGFFFDRASRQILANEGNIIVTTNRGVAYIVKFGEEFSGTEVDLQVGQAAAKSATEESTAADDAESDVKPANGRYIFVGASFSAESLGPKPEPPVKPEPPAAKAEAAADAPVESDPAATPAVTPADPEQEAYEKALKDYELAQSVYPQQLEFYEEDVKQAKERVESLNRRFADWYYVVGDDVYKRLRLTRSTIIEPATPAAPADGAGLMLPGLDGPIPPTPSSEDTPSNENSTPATDTTQSTPVPPAKPMPFDPPAVEQPETPAAEAATDANAAAAE